MVYLDNAATAMPLPEAVAAAHAAMARGFGNPSSVHALGREARQALEAARGHVAAALGCPPGRVVFTSGGTESINTALTGAMHKNRRLGRHIVATQVEHDAVLAVVRELKQQGCEVTLVAPEADGSVSAQAVAAAVREDTALVSMQAVNNETGAAMPYARVAGALKARNPGALFHLDAVQALCEGPLALEHVDFASVSGHKIGGIKGCGALYAASDRALRPLMLGGGQESGLRSGTEAMPAIAAFGEACRVRRERLAQDKAQLEALRGQLLESLAARGVRHRVLSPRDGAPHIVSLSLPGAPSEVYIRLLSDREIYVSGGSACKRGKRSHVLAAMGLPAGEIDSALRVSLSPLNTGAEVDALCGALADIQKTLPGGK